MNENYTFTFAQTDDLPRILEIFEKSIRADYDVADQIIQKCLADLAEAFNNRQHDFSFWVAKETENGKVIGWLSYLPIFDSILKKDTALEASIYLDAEFRANGLGFEFLSHTIKQIQGFHLVFAFLNANKIPSIKLFAKIGFESVGKIPSSENAFPYFSEKNLFIYKLK
ncbi:MAG TPA: GNAT family N-acetyltransferase [Pyrinomonadaceae bacterium]|nr:GNAT family N-acetyltransferase [Pyrinomonadaceae bacterium]